MQRTPALGLFLIAPFVAEFLLGNMSVDLLWLLVVLAPLYGAGALLVRELALRWRARWPGRFALGLAYGVLEEGVITQSLFAPNYLGLRLLDYGYVPALGIGAWWTVFVLGLHGVWSTCASIGLAEALWPAQRRARWVSDPLLPFAAVLFAAGGLATVWLSGGPKLVATPLQLASAVLAAMGFVAVAARGARVVVTAPTDGRRAPAPLGVGAAAFVLLSLFMVSTWSTTTIPATWNVAWMLSALALLAWCLRRWSHRGGWGGLHELAVVAGALATYAWWSLVLPATVSRVSALVDTLGNVALILMAAGLVALAARRTRGTGGTGLPAQPLP